ncbi:MAG: hypothetical protein R3Y43_04320 [Alphaproteobacteria bacterium]
MNKISQIINILKLKQPSTWRGIIGIFGSFGLVINPELTEQIIAICIAGIGIVEVIRNERSENNDNLK